MLLHAVDSANKGYRRIILHTADTGVLVLAVSTVSLEDTEIWVAFGTGKHLRYIPAHDIARELGYEKAPSLPMFHACTGCDTVSSFAGREKRQHLTYGSLSMRSHLYFLSCCRPIGAQRRLYLCVGGICCNVLLCDRTCTETTVNLARKHIFTTKGRSMDNLPPTRVALLQHTKRAVYQGGYVWEQALVRCPFIPSPETYGWQKSTTQG